MGLERTDAAPPPAAPKGPSFGDFIATMAKALNLNVQKKTDNLYVIPYALAENRKQNAFVFPMGKSPLGHHVVGFFSPALKLAPGQDLNPKTLSQLLRRNATMFYGAWIIVPFDGADYLGVQETVAAENMQPEEFKTAGLSVAVMADAFEKELGADLF